MVQFPASPTHNVSSLGFWKCNVGGVNVANYGFSGAMHEIVLANVLLTLADRQKLEGYLAGKWGLRPLLPAAHPYKSTTP